VPSSPGTWCAPSRQRASDHRSRRSRTRRPSFALERALAALSPAYREVALLVGGEGMQPTEVAEILGLRADAVRQRLARARSQLAEALGDHAPASWRAT